jgi:hypothetical protein
MTSTIDQAPVAAPVETDLPTLVQRVLAASSEPLTLSKIRSRLPGAFRTMALEELGESLRRQVAANVLYQYPKYRSSQDRFWDRPMPVHIVALLREVLQTGPLPWAELRRKLPSYAVAQAESLLLEQTAQGLLHRHPRGNKRGGDRFGLQPADPKDYLRQDLAEVFCGLEKLGFTQSQLRAGALELLHDEEWSPTAPTAAAPVVPEPSAAAPTSAPAAATEPPAPAPVEHTTPPATPEMY